MQQLLGSQNGPHLHPTKSAQEQLVTWQKTWGSSLLDMWLMSLKFSILAPPPLLGTDSRPSVGVPKDLFGCYGDGDLIIHLQDSSGKRRQGPCGCLEKARAPKSETKEISDLGHEEGGMPTITSFRALRMDRNTDWNLHPVS